MTATVGRKEWAGGRQPLRSQKPRELRLVLGEPAPGAQRTAPQPRARPGSSHSQPQPVAEQGSALPHCRTVQAASLHVAQAPAAPHAAAQIHRSLLHVAGRLQVSCCMVVACYICHVARVMLHGLLHLATCTQYVASRRAVMLRLTCCASHRTARACYVLLAAHDAP